MAIYVIEQDVFDELEPEVQTSIKEGVVTDEKKIAEIKKIVSEESVEDNQPNPDVPYKKSPLRITIENASNKMVSKDMK